MSDELDQNQQFAAMSPEAQQIVRQKLSSLSPEAQQIVKQKLGGQPQSLLQRIKSQITNPQNISAVARPILQGGGAILGGAAGLPAAPETAGLSSFAGGAAGFAAGDQAANLLDQKLGVQKPPQTIGGIVASGADSLMQGGQAEAAGLVLGPVMRMAGKYIAKPLSSVLTGVPQSDYDALVKNSANILPSTLKNASASLNTAKEAAGITPDPIADINRALREDKPFISQLKEKMMGGQVLTPREAFEGNQAINRLIKNETDDDAKRGLTMLKQSFQDNLASLPGDVLSALKQYGEAKGGNKFLNVLPMTKQGNPAVVRSLAMLSRMMGGAGVGSIPALAGVGTIAGSQAYNAVSNPVVQHGVISPLMAALLSKRNRSAQ